MADNPGPFRLTPWFSVRPWGRRDLRPWYSATRTSDPIGEAWLTGPNSVAETGPLAGRCLHEIVAEYPTALLGPAGAEMGDEIEFPLLVKMLFPAEKLSVQVHPDDAHARALGQARGKTECWYILEGEPAAAVALGFRDKTTADEVRAAVADGTMEDRLRWVPVVAGEMVFVDAGTVHAIGPGLVILETQQTSDTTFRMYDYGRARELHVEQGLRVMKEQTEAGLVAPHRMHGFTRLIEQRYFTVDRYDVAAGSGVRFALEAPGCVAGLRGAAWVEVAGAEPVELVPGSAVVLPVRSDEVVIRSEPGAQFVRCFAPQRP